MGKGVLGEEFIQFVIDYCVMYHASFLHINENLCTHTNRCISYYHTEEHNNTEAKTISAVTRPFVHQKEVHALHTHIHTHRKQMIPVFLLTSQLMIKVILHLCNKNKKCIFASFFNCDLCINLQRQILKKIFQCTRLSL